MMSLILCVVFSTTRMEILFTLTGKWKPKGLADQTVSCLIFFVCSLLCANTLIADDFNENELNYDFSSYPGAAPLLRFNTHHPFVNTMQRSPFFKDIILTTGGLNFAIWKEGVMVTTLKHVF